MTHAEEDYILSRLDPELRSIAKSIRRNNKKRLAEMRPIIRRMGVAVNNQLKQLWKEVTSLRDKKKKGKGGC